MSIESHLSSTSSGFCIGTNIAVEEKEHASVYHLYRFKRKLLAVCALMAELNRKKNEHTQKKAERLVALQSRIEYLQSSIALHRKLTEEEKARKDKKFLHLCQRTRYKVLSDKRKQLQLKKQNLESHLKNERLNLRIKTAYLKSLRQQYLHALLTDVFPIICTDMGTDRKPFAKSIYNGGGIESTLLSSVAPSALNQDQFHQLDEAINTHYLGQGFWSSDQDSTYGLKSDSHYSYGIVSITLSQPEKYDQLVNLIDKLYSTQQKMKLSNGRNQRSGSALDILDANLAAELPGASNLACHLQLDESILSRAYDQGAALSHLAQLVYISSYILSVALPFRQWFYFFMGFDYSPRALHDALCKLDLNIICLCSSQGVAPNKLRPDHNIRNLIHCFSLSNPHLGESQVSFQLDFDLMSRVEDFFTRYDNLNRMRFDRSNATDEDPTDWEELPATIALTEEEMAMIEHTYSNVGGAGGRGSLSGTASRLTSAVVPNSQHILNTSAAAFFSTVGWIAKKSMSITE